MMGKEHVIEEFGVPDFTVSIGTLGRRLHQPADRRRVPGPVRRHPDQRDVPRRAVDRARPAWTRTCWRTTSPTIDAHGFTDAQTGRRLRLQGMKAFLDAANQSQRTDPVRIATTSRVTSRRCGTRRCRRRCRYDPADEPARRAADGVRRRASTSTAPIRRPASRCGRSTTSACSTVSTALNGRQRSRRRSSSISTRDRRLRSGREHVAARSVGDAGAIKRAYQGGADARRRRRPRLDPGVRRWRRTTTSAAITISGTTSRSASGSRKQNGNADNHVMWRGPVQADGGVGRCSSVGREREDRHGDRDAARKGDEEKAGAAVDGCWIVEARKADVRRRAQTFSSKPDSKCNAAYPSSAFTRYVAGGPIDANVLKCQLKPIDAKDYPSFTPAELQRLKTIFPGGTCDYSKPGVNQTRVMPWASFGPSPENLVFDPSAQVVELTRRAMRRHADDRGRAGRGGGRRAAQRRRRRS